MTPSWGSRASGDLVLTCTDDQSRNRRFGLELAAGKTAEQALADIGQVVEGYPAAKALHAVAARAGVEMPLCEGVYRVLYEGVPRAGCGPGPDDAADQVRDRLGDGTGQRMMIAARTAPISAPITSTATGPADSA